MALFQIAVAEVGIGTDKQFAALVVGHHFIKEGVIRTTDTTDVVPFLHLEGIIIKIEAYYAGVGGHSVDSLLKTSSKQLQGWHLMHFWIVELGNG